MTKLLTIPDTQWCDLLTDIETGAAACAALSDHLASTSSRWDVLCLDRLPPHSGVERLLIPALKAGGIFCRLEAVDSNLFIDLRDDWETYYASRPRSVKKMCNLASNRLNRVGCPQVVWLQAEDVDDAGLSDLLDTLIMVSAGSWKSRLQNSLTMPGPRAFIHELTQFARAQDALSVWLLRLDDEPIAIEYQIFKDGTLHALRADFDERYRHVSPGTFLNRQLIEKLFHKGFQRYYLGPGQNSYKKQWNTSETAVYELKAYANTVRGQFARQWWKLKAQLRMLKNARQPR